MVQHSYTKGATPLRQQYNKAILTSYRCFIRTITHFLESPRAGRFLRKGENVSGKD